MSSTPRFIRCIIFVAALNIFTIATCTSQVATDALVPENGNEARLNRIQPPDKVLDSIGVKEGMIVGEIGAGRGRYTVQIANCVGKSGKVFANDIDFDALQHLQKRCQKWNINNVEIVRGEEADPRFAENSLDLIFMISTYHHITDPVALMRNALPALKPDGRLAIVEWAPREDGSNRGSSTTPEDLVEQMKKAGYKIERTETFLVTNNIYLFSRDTMPASAR